MVNSSSAVNTVTFIPIYRWTGFKLACLVMLEGKILDVWFTCERMLAKKYWFIIYTIYFLALRCILTLVNSYGCLFCARKEKINILERGQNGFCHDCYLHVLSVWKNLRYLTLLIVSINSCSVFPLLQAALVCA